MTARNIRCRFIRHLALLLCVLMMFPAVFSLLKVSSYALTSDVLACEITEIGEVYYLAGGAKPIPEIEYEGTPLVLGKDFTVSYKDNKQLGTATVIIKGKGHFYGTVEKTFTVKARPLTETEITVSDVFYTEQGEMPKVAVSAEGKYFKEGVDYTVSYSSGETPYTARVTVIGSGLLTGSKELTFNVMGVPIAQAEIICESALAYTGDGLFGVTAVNYKGNTLTQNVDYTVSYQNNIDVGTAVATVTGIGNYSGIITKEFQIIPADISGAEFTVSGNYKPTGVTLTVEGSYLGKLISSEDFSYSVPESAGRHQLVISGQGNFCGEKTIDVNIESADVSNATVKTTFINDGDDYLISVYYGETELIKDVDYNIVITENGNYANVTVTGIGNYSGTLTDRVQISGLKMLEMVQLPQIPDQIYTGEYIRPPVSITYKGKELTYGTDYYLTYENNINVGTTVITVTGVGVNQGIVREIPFNILPFDINGCKLLCDNVTYTGEAVKPLPTITFGRYQLENKKDYIINSYTNNVNAGNGTVSVTGTGNFCGTADISFAIVKKEYMQELIKERLDEMMQGLHDRKINSYIHSYKLGNYYNTYMTSPCACHSFCMTGYESDCSCLIGRSEVLSNSGIQCAGFTMEVFQYLFGGTNVAGGNILTKYNRSESVWTEQAIREWMITSFRPGDYMAYDNVVYDYPHYITVYSVETDGIWVYEANYGGRCKINLRKMTYTEIYNQLDGIYHRTPNNYQLSDA